MILYATPLSSYALKVRLALAFKGVDVEFRPPPGGYHSAAYRALVPAASVPALVEGDFVLCESDAIIEYLDEIHPARSLLPGGPETRARSRMLSRLHDFRTEPPIRSLFGQLAPATRDEALVRERFADFATAIELVGLMATPGPFLCGAEPSLADCAFPATLILARRLGAAFGVPVSEPAWLATWDEALRERPATCEVLGAYEVEIDTWIESRLA